MESLNVLNREGQGSAWDDTVCPFGFVLSQKSHLAQAGSRQYTKTMLTEHLDGRGRGRQERCAIKENDLRRRGRDLETNRCGLINICRRKGKEFSQFEFLFTCF